MNKEAKTWETFDFFKHGSGVIVQHTETGETGISEVREGAPEVLELYVNFGSGPEPVNRFKVIVPLGEEA